MATSILFPFVDTYVQLIDFKDRSYIKMAAITFSFRSQAKMPLVRVQGCSLPTYTLNGLEGSRCDPSALTNWTQRHAGMKLVATGPAHLGQPASLLDVDTLFTLVVTPSL